MSPSRANVAGERSLSGSHLPTNCRPGLVLGRPARGVSTHAPVGSRSNGPRGQPTKLSIP
jgi:hypothetical protein